MKLTILFTVCLGLPAWTLAQTASETPAIISLPEGPLLANPEFAQWQVTVAIGKPAAAASGTASPVATGTAPAPLVLGAVIMKTRTIRYEQIKDANGEDLVKWCDGDMQWFRRQGWPQCILYTGPDDNNPYYVSYAKSPFPEVAWVSSRNFQGIQTLGGNKCLVFSGKKMLFSGSQLEDIRDNLKKAGKPFVRNDYMTDVTAFIEITSRLPVLYQAGNATYTYKYSTPPASMLTLPPEMEASKEAEAQKRKDYARRPPAA